MADKKISALTASSTPLAGTEVLPIVQSGATVKVSVADLTAGRSFDALGMTLTSTDAGVAAAPTLDLYRDSASPAASDTLGEIKFNGEDSAGNKQQYALIHAAIISPTSTSEGGQLHFETTTLGSSTEKMRIGTSGDVTLLTGNLVIGTSGKGIDFSITSHPAGMTSELLSDYEEGTFTATLFSQTPPTTPPTTTAKYTKIGRLVTVTISFTFVDTSGGSGYMAISGLPFTASDIATSEPVLYGIIFTGVPIAYVAAAGTIIYFGELKSGLALGDLAITAGTGKYVQLSTTYFT